MPSIRLLIPKPSSSPIILPIILPIIISYPWPWGSRPNKDDSSRLRQKASIVIPIARARALPQLLLVTFIRKSRVLRAADRYAYTGCGSTAYCYLFYWGRANTYAQKNPLSVENLSRANSWFLPSWVSLQLAHTSCGVRACK